MKPSYLINVIFGLLCWSGIANAELFDRGNGLIYDDVLNVTWLQDVNLAASNDFGIPEANLSPTSPGEMSRETANQFIDAMNAANYKGFSNWRLPKLLPVDGVELNAELSFDGSTDNSYNIFGINSELANLHYATLGNPGLFNTDGTTNTLCSGASRCINNSGPFINLDPLPNRGYWSDAVDLQSGASWSFGPALGRQIALNPFSSQRVWPVRDGDVSSDDDTDSSVEEWEKLQWLSGDFDGDGLVDIVKVLNDGGLVSIDVYISDGIDGIDGLILEQWATKKGDFLGEQHWLSGDFNGDGRSDLAKVFNDQGLTSIDVYLSRGNGRFKLRRWITGQGSYSNTQKWVAGDLNGDGNTDIATSFFVDEFIGIDLYISNGRRKFSLTPTDIEEPFPVGDDGILVE